MVFFNEIYLYYDIVPDILLNIVLKVCIIKYSIIINCLEI